MKTIIFFCCILFSSLMTVSASAYVINLGLGNNDLNGYTGPFATVTVELEASNIAHLTVTGAAYGPNNNYFMGDGALVALNVNATNFTAYQFSAFTMPGFEAPEFTEGGPGNVSEFGAFNFTLNNSDGWRYAAYQIELRLLNAGTWASPSDVLTSNNKGFMAASHIFVPNTTPATVAGGAATTGYAGGAMPVPAPASILLLASGLAGFAYRKARGKTASLGRRTNVTPLG